MSQPSALDEKKRARRPNAPARIRQRVRTIEIALDRRLASKVQVVNPEEHYCWHCRLLNTHAAHIMAGLGNSIGRFAGTFRCALRETAKR